jgi:D-3-phosphoglycerate dehydrogenase
MLPQFKETKGLVSADLISKMKRGVLFINTARASIVDNEALQKAIADGIIGGAALDVFDMEPLDENNEFLKFNNVICTPHIGSVTDGCIAIQSKMVVDDILAILDKKEPVNILNPEVLGLKKPEKTIVQLGQEIIDTCKTLVKEGLYLVLLEM